MKVDLAREADFRLGGLDVRPSRREVVAGPERSILEPRVMQVLVALVRRRGEVVSRDELIARCWDGRIVGDDAINACVAKVRRVGEAHHAFEIETVPRVGYRMRLLQGGARRPGGARAPWRWALGIATAGLVGLGAWSGYHAWTEREALENPRIAVRPFRLLTDDAEARAFAKEADTEISGAFSEGVVQTASADRAAFVVDGSVTASQARLRVRASLVDRRANVTLWSAEFDRPKSGAETLPADIAWRTATVMDQALEAKRRGGASLDPEVLALYVKSVDAIGLADGSPVTTMGDVVRRAPRFAPAHAELAAGLLARAVLARQPQFEALRKQAVGEAREALRLDPRTANAYSVLAGAMDARRWAERDALVTKAAALGRLGQSSGPRVAFLMDVGRLNEAAQLGRRAAQPHRTWPGAAWQIDYAVYLSGSSKEAEALVRRDLRVRPNDLLLKVAALQVASFGGAPDDALQIINENPLGWSGMRASGLEAFRAFLAAQKSGAEVDRQDAVALILRASRAKGLLHPYAIPMLARLGAVDEAFLVAEGYARDPFTYRMGWPFTSYFLFGPETALMRRDPRFILLVKQLGLLDYWRTSGVWPDFCENESQSVCAEMKQVASAGPSTPAK